MSIALQVKVENLESEVTSLKAQFAALQAQLNELNERVIPAVITKRDKKARETEEII